MKITKFTACNFRIFKRVDVDLRGELSLIIGKNNSGKTSLLMLFDRFYQDGNKFSYDDFPIECRKLLSKIEARPAFSEISIRMMLEITYSDSDNLRFLSEFITDLDPAINRVKILFECTIDQDALIKDLPEPGEKRERFLRRNTQRYLKRDVYAYSDESEIFDKREKLIKKDMHAVRNIINFQFIHARRDVASSEGGKNVLSKLTTQYFNANNTGGNDFGPINDLMLDMDRSLEKTYKEFFSPFLGAAQKFLGIDDIKVISNLESKEILEDASQVVYGGGPGYLPETFNGLGHMNILYVLLAIEIRKEEFKRNIRQINLLFIEEPEAHTHPQMQYVFAREIKNLLKGIVNLQSVITTHSSHIVSQCDFKDIRYLQCKAGVVTVKNFHEDLAASYGAEKASFQFVEQFLTLDTCELFFADKVIFIEGTTESILLPYFMAAYDESHNGEEGYIPLLSQNITIVEAGANAKAFRHLLDFLDIKGLVITDIDTTVQVKKAKITYEASPVASGTHTSNETIKYYYAAPNIHTPEFSVWMQNLKEGKLASASPNIKVCYQLDEDKYQARSFEDAFVHINRATVEQNLDSLNGLKNKDDFTTIFDPYTLIDTVLSKKSDFAASLLFLALTDKNVQWKMPFYVKQGLDWVVA
ncbi:ATP-dependent endonuclease [Massilia sp. PAMC28688]|uniref:ATP-dependent nuclease n=1 Tax=Massilia sp. PAMC28688 TaxID=2861283 RepID=UPI001C63014F|nr:ATP-dependent endonuclease [Massilia sp. PAMC28688]QYF93253.1 ATP-dependent endonuclease [Massilia sp. PAMC28688]